MFNTFHRNIFGSLESLHTMRLSHPCTVDIHSYMWSKRDSSKYSTRLVGAHGKIGKDGRVDDSGSTERNERRGVLSFLELLKITGCEDYPSLKELVEQRYNLFVYLYTFFKRSLAFKLHWKYVCIAFLASLVIETFI